MYIHVPYKAAAVAALWLASPIIIILAVVALLVKHVVASVVLAFFCVFLLLLTALYISRIKMYVGKNHVSLRHGLWFKFTHRLTRRFISGVHIIELPLQSIYSSCIIIIISSCGFYIVPGIGVKMAQKLADTLVLRSRE